MTKIENVPTENLWAILRGETNIDKIMELSGFTQEEIDKQREVITKAQKENHPYKTFANAVFYRKHLTYYELVRRKEIDGDKIFNMRTASYDTDNAEGDLGQTMRENWVYMDKEWKNYTHINETKH